MKNQFVLLGAAVLLTPAIGYAAITQSATPALLVELFNCQAIAEQQGRLGCFDRTVTALKLAVGKSDVVVADRETMREARRGLFGLSLPRIRLFGDGGDDATEAVESIDAKIAAVGQGGEGGWLVTLEDGVRWQQVDNEYVNRPRPGQSITIRRATMSGYMAKVENGRGFRVRRIAD